jgi:WD40 repeat protein
VAIAIAAAAFGFAIDQIRRARLAVAVADVKIDSLSSEHLFASGKPMLALRDSLLAGQALQALDPTLREQEKNQVTAALMQAVMSERNSLAGHQDKVNRVSFSPDGKTIASASSDNTIKLWNWDFDRLMAMGCDQIRPYLVTYPEDRGNLPLCQKLEE